MKVLRTQNVLEFLDSILSSNPKSSHIEIVVLPQSRIFQHLAHASSRPLTVAHINALYSIQIVVEEGYTSLLCRLQNIMLQEEPGKKTAIAFYDLFTGYTEPEPKLGDAPTINMILYMLARLTDSKVARVYINLPMEPSSEHKTLLFLLSKWVDEDFEDGCGALTL